MKHVFAAATVAATLFTALPAEANNRATDEISVKHGVGYLTVQQKHHSCTKDKYPLIAKTSSEVRLHYAGDKDKDAIGNIGSYLKEHYQKTLAPVMGEPFDRFMGIISKNEVNKAYIDMSRLFEIGSPAKGPAYKDEYRALANRAAAATQDYLYTMNSIHLEADRFPTLDELIVSEKPDSTLCP